MSLPVPLLINGESITTPKTFPIISPYTNTEIWSSSSASPEDALRAVEAANAAFPSWSTTKPTLRRDILLKAANNLEASLDENASYMRQEMGADVGASAGFVVPLAIRMLRDIASRITSICGSVPVVEAEGQSAIIYKEAMGVILGIVPWNAPYVFGIRSAACALAAGNTTILKSSELTPRCYWAIGKAFQDAGLPDGCLNVIHCAAEDAPGVVNAMIEHEAVRKVNFTGTWGKNSSIVCQDADLGVAVQGVLAGAFLNSGQICMATDRILVHSSIVGAFTAALQGALSGAAAAAADPPTLVNVASKARVEALVAGAVSAGAHFISGSGKGAAGEGVRLAPTVLGGVKEDMAVWQEESFASVAAIMPFDSEEEAIRLANGSGYGLSASVFTEDLRKGLRMAKRIQSGAVHINSMTIHDEPALPHGGVKNSGWGRFNTEEGLNEFLVSKSVTWMD
ncbi:Aldehyde/histidinol dehydrogenase [Penicillium brevicompactum]|uniref:Aldehyde/histidinol dehydrogenase n=1 Tax=Penicillium brevicompactum TaxID=5074 RepID=A0A9W9RWT3_PENBR|nr:Aldehyde/histidinol dehydrogenase [Penicillium brevicompactum]KAJ5348012.1 Aldehyde/histidinol dehydrogenase [Penicillium brevicompactum]KAJ5367095.1 Aldehyde/histidinol dehydrogenase [Penicillium brevicompactum]